ncbi:hypothetical protein GH714_026005 [Hevea brasiliensis]|uniref:40S ribosomal protein S7 n=1 Tax=Hevea brasiliensis TaxID=3981 RepID=A0A6A6K8T4_HEVBR|nr:hypothetical protein GH714_026005 [Hevea brasiliensis]
MYTTKQKIHKDKDAEPTEFEESVAQAFFDLENTNQELKSDMKDLYINSAIQIDVAGNRKAVVIHVPFRLRKAYRKIHVRLDVILIATRRILRPPKKGSAVQRPRSRTLTAVHEAMLEDIVLPAEIVGKRTRYRIDGSKIMKVFLDPKERNNTEYKLDTFAAVYRKLSGKDVVFEFPELKFSLYLSEKNFEDVYYKAEIHKDKDAEPTEFEESVAQAFFDLENTNQELKSDMKDLYINSAIQIDVAGNRKAVVIHVPFRLRKAYRKIHVRLVRELEKFSGKDVILIATRRILRPPRKGSAAQRPRSRTLTAVHEAMLEDIVLPAEIVGKRTRYRIDGSKIMKVFLDPKERNNTEYKLDTFAAVYRKLSGKDVVCLTIQEQRHKCVRVGFIIQSCCEIVIRDLPPERSKLVSYCLGICNYLVMEEGGGSGRHRRLSLLDQMSAIENRRELAGLTLDDVLASDKRPTVAVSHTPPQANRTLLDIIRDDEPHGSLFGNKDKKSWKAFRERLRLKRAGAGAGSAWTSSVPIPASDIPIQNSNYSFGNNINNPRSRNSMRFT